LLLPFLAAVSILAISTSSTLAMTIKKESIKTWSVPNQTDKLSGTFTILEDNGTIKAYGQTYLYGFFQGTSYPTTLKLVMYPKIMGNQVAVINETATRGNNVPFEFVNMGPVNTSQVYSIEGYHYAYKDGVWVAGGANVVYW